MHPLLFHIGSLLIPSYGAMAALGVLAALFLAQHTARVSGVNAGQVWNLSIVALCAALVAERLLLVAANWGALRGHPSWLLALAMIHHPLLAGAGALAGGGCALWYALWRRLPLRSTADTLAAPLVLCLACEQIGALLAGSGYGTEAGPGVHWAVIYTSPLAARWSGTPLGIPLHPVQGYAALGFFALATLLLLWLPRRRRPGDAAGLCLMGIGVTVYFTELWRDPDGRGWLLGGTLDGPQAAAIVLVLAGALLLLDSTAWAAPKQAPKPGAETAVPIQSQSGGGPN